MLVSCIVPLGCDSSSCYRVESGILTLPAPSPPQETLLIGRHTPHPHPYTPGGCVVSPVGGSERTAAHHTEDTGGEVTTGRRPREDPGGLTAREEYPGGLTAREEYPGGEPRTLGFPPVPPRPHKLSRLTGLTSTTTYLDSSPVMTAHSSLRLYSA